MNKRLIKSLLLLSLLIFLWACADEGAGTEEETQHQGIETTTTMTDTVTLNSSISTPAASLTIRIAGKSLPTSDLTATILGDGNDCGEYKLSAGFVQTSQEIQLDAPLPCLTTNIIDASQIGFSQNLNNVTVTALENEGGGVLTPLAFGTIGNPASTSRIISGNFTESESDDVIDLGDVIYLYAFIQGTQDKVENLTTAGQTLVSSLEVPATVLPSPIFDNYTENATDKVVDLADVVYLYAYFQGTTDSLASLEAAGKALLPTLTASPTVMPGATNFETVTLTSPITNTPASNLVIRIVGSDLPTTNWKAVILGTGNDCGGYELASSFSQSSNEILLEASFDCLTTTLTDVSQIIFNQELNGATVTLQINEGSGTFTTIGSSVSADITSPANPAVSINGGAASTTDALVSLSLSASDNESVDAYFISENPTTPNISAPEWIIVPSNPIYSDTVAFTLSQESENGSYSKTIYVWFKDTSGNLSSPISDTITLVVADPTSTALPIHQAAGVSFIDTDLEVGQLSGDVVISRAEDESDITDYLLYWGSDTTTQLVSHSAITTLPKTGNHLTYNFVNTTVPSGATHLLVYTKNNVGEMSSGIAFSFTDNVLQTKLRVAAGVKHSCVVMNDGTVKCWGQGSYGRLGNGSTDDSSTPVLVSGISNAVNVSVRSFHSCAVLSNGTIKCWGRGKGGRLGNGSTNDSSVPVEVSNISNAIQVTVGKAHSCALLNDGAVKCWGVGRAGRLGHGSTKKSTIPVTVNGINSAVQVSAGNVHTCVVLSDGNVQCWGKGSYQRLGNGSTENSNIPVTVNDVSSAVQVSAGGFHTCSSLNDGSIKCWGYGKLGQLGNGSNATYSAPVTVSGVSSAIEVSAGGFHTCARLKDGLAQCWGRGSHGRLGNSGTSSANIPETVGTLSSTVQLATGNAHTCAILSDETVMCWGRGSHYRLGTGNTSNAFTPMAVVGL